MADHTRSKDIPNQLMDLQRALEEEQLARLREFEQLREDIQLKDTFLAQ